MSKRLYPRLLKSRAGVLYAALSEAEGQAAHSDRNEESSVTYAATGPQRITTDELAALRDAVVAAAAAHGYPSPLAGADRAAFDADLALALFRTARLFPAEASVAGVWSFLALVLLPDVARWRFGTTNVERFIATDLTRHVFARLWWRAYLVRGGDKSDEELMRSLGALGEADFDQIQARRTAFGASPHFFSAFVEAWVQLKPRLGESDVAEREILRTSLAQLLRLGSFIEYEALAPRQLRVRINTVIAEAAGLESLPIELESGNRA